MQLPSAGQYEFDDFRLDVPKRQLLRAGEPVGLNPKAFDLLLVLVENAGQLLSKEDLFRRVWEDQIVEESNLTVNMSAIRKALGEKAKQPRYITTISGEGYRFTGDVREVVSDRDEEFVIESQTISRVTIEQEDFESDAPALATKTRAVASQIALEIPKTDAQTRTRASVSNLTRVAVAALCLTALGLGGYLGLRKISARNASLPFNSVKRLTNNGKVAAAALAPDGKLFAYTVSEGEQETLWLGHVDGGEPIEIRPPVQMIYMGLRFAPDGSSLYYVLSESFKRGTLYRIPVFGGVPEKIRDDITGAIAFGPDGKQFAYIGFDEQKKQATLVIADLQNASEQIIATPPADTAFVPITPAWSLDGSMIAVIVARRNELSYEVVTVGVADHAMKPLIKRGWSGVRALTWKPDESGLILIAREEKSSLWQAWEISFPDGEARRITADLNFYGASISMSSEKLLAVQTQQESNVWVAPAENLSAAKQVTFGSFGQDNGWNGLGWMPDGRIIYTKLSEQGLNIWTMNADGSKQKQLIPSGGDNFYPSVSSDNRFVIFQSNRSNEVSIWRADIEGGNLVQLTKKGIAAQPALSPDGKWVVYVTSPENASVLWRISTEGGEPQRLTEKEYSWMGISPDSRFIAAGYEENGQPKIALISIDGGEPLQTFSAPRLANFRLGIHWTPDGKAVTYRDWANGIWKQPLSGGSPSRLEGLPAEKLFCYGWSRDGKQFAYARGTAISDVVLFLNTK